MANSTACPVCDAEEGWSVLVRTQVGVRLPDDSRAAEDEQTRREVRVCETCGVCYDPVVATGPPEADGEPDDKEPGTDAEPPPTAVTEEVATVHEEVSELADALVVVANVQARMARVTSDVDGSAVADALSRAGLLSE